MSPSLESEPVTALSDRLWQKMPCDFQAWSQKAMQWCLILRNTVLCSSDHGIRSLRLL